jgi:hypothetical protein
MNTFPDMKCSCKYEYIEDPVAGIPEEIFYYGGKW